MSLPQGRTPGLDASRLPPQHRGGQGGVAVADGAPGGQPGTAHAPHAPRALRPATDRITRGSSLPALLPFLLCFLLCCGLGFQSWTALRATGFDLGIFDQAIRAYAHFELPRSPIKNVHHEFPPGFSLLGDHFSPVLALLAPLYWVWDDPRVLILAQAALFAAGVPVVRGIARHCFAGTAPTVVRRAADGAGLVYALGWPLLSASHTTFHEVAFAVPFTLLMLERGLAHRYTAAALWAGLLCTVKEDMGLVAGAFGLLLAVRAHRAGHRRGRSIGVTVLVAGPLLSALLITCFLPAMGGQPGYYWSYDRLGADPGSALTRMFTEPWVVAQVAFSPFIKVTLLAWVLGTLALLPLGSPTLLLAAPLLAERVLSDNPNHWPVINHYDAFLWPVLLTAALETLARLHRSKAPRVTAYGRRLPRQLTVAAVSLSTAASLFLGLGPLLNPDSWRPTAGQRALARAAELIPDGATVEADNNIAPRLTARTQVVLADATPRGADWVLLRDRERAFPFASVEEQQQRITLLLAHGHEEVWRGDGAVLLRRVHPTHVPGTSRPGPDSVPVREQVPADVGRSLF
ncbi:DUF2079 domain-containing protein [Streptomyces sp. NPDC058657]|uniref:DUF2079 domain-containing protein n=1 Tax=unclassified Streptomyces TaxID=2593676 RepID=UPI00364FFB6D